jgi:hypothetical protein
LGVGVSMGGMGIGMGVGVRIGMGIKHWCKHWQGAERHMWRGTEVE